MFYIAGGIGVVSTKWASLAYHRRLAEIVKLANLEIKKRADPEIEPQQRTPQPLAE